MPCAARRSADVPVADLAALEAALGMAGELPMTWRALASLALLEEVVCP